MEYKECGEGVAEETAAAVSKQEEMTEEGSRVMGLPLDVVSEIVESVSGERDAAVSKQQMSEEGLRVTGLPLGVVYEIAARLPPESYETLRSIPPEVLNSERSSTGWGIVRDMVFCSMLPDGSFGFVIAEERGTRMTRFHFGDYGYDNQGYVRLMFEESRFTCEYPLQNGNRDTSSCDGCIYGNSVMYNPSTGESSSLPHTEAEVNAYGFGYSNIQNRYKFIRVVPGADAEIELEKKTRKEHSRMDTVDTDRDWSWYVKKVINNDKTVQVMTLGDVTDTWTSVETVNLKFTKQQGTYATNGIHWVCLNEDDGFASHKMVTFCLNTGKFKRLGCPLDTLLVDANSELELSVIGERLCLIQYQYNILTLWRNRYSGSKVSRKWEDEIRVNLFGQAIMYSPFAIIHSRELLLLYQNRFLHFGRLGGVAALRDVQHVDSYIQEDSRIKMFPGVRKTIVTLKRQRE